MADDYVKKKLVKAFKKKFAPSGTVIERPECGEVIALRGDRSKNIRRFLLDIGRAQTDPQRFAGFQCFWLTKLKGAFPCNE